MKWWNVRFIIYTLLGLASTFFSLWHIYRDWSLGGLVGGITAIIMTVVGVFLGFTINELRNYEDWS